MSTKHKTIKSVPEASLEAFNEFKNNGAYANDTQAFIALIKLGLNPVNPVDTTELQSKLESLQQENADLKAKYDGARFAHESTNTSLNEEITKVKELQARLIDIEAREPATKEVQVPIELTDTQFIVDMPEDMITKARMVRSQMRKADKFSGTDDEFAGFLSVEAIKYFIKHKYEEIYERK